MKRLLLLFIFISLPSVGWAYELGSAGEMAEGCSTLMDESNIKRNFDNAKNADDIEAALKLVQKLVQAVGSCHSGMRGILDTIQVYEHEMEKTNSGARLICIPDGVSNQQIIKIFTKYTDDHPEVLHESAALIVMRALGQSFPCPK